MKQVRSLVLIVMQTTATRSLSRSRMNKFGYPSKKWAALKREARQILISVAEQRALITYSELCARIQGESFEPHDLRMWEVIGDISRDEEAAGRGLLSVLVVHKHGDLEAGRGFTSLADYFGRDVSDRTRCFVDEVKRVHYYWSVKANTTRTSVKSV